MKMKTGVPGGPGPRLPFTDAPRDLFTHLPEKNDPEFRRFFLLKNPAFPSPRAAGGGKMWDSRGAKSKWQ